MERMTYRLEDQYGNYICMGTTKKLEVVLSRLAAYEDTGLEPEEIVELKGRMEGAGEMKRLTGSGCLFAHDAFERLKKIEDILGDEYDLDRLRELAQADREGKIPKYTIGDTIYDRFGNAWEVTAVERHLLAGEAKWIYRCGHIGTNDYCALWEFEVLTHAEAQAALRREQE